MIKTVWPLFDTNNHLGVNSIHLTKEGDEFRKRIITKKYHEEEYFDFDSELEVIRFEYWNK